MNQTTRIPTRDAIVEAAFLILSRDPSAPLSAVAEAAGVGRATLHRYFASRDTLVRQLAEFALNEMDEAVEVACADAESAAEVLQSALEVLIPLGDRHGFLAHEPLVQDDATQAEFDRHERETEEMVDAAKREGVFDSNVPTAWIVQAYNYLLYAAWESVRTKQATASQAAELAWRTLTAGLGDRA